METLCKSSEIKYQGISISCRARFFCTRLTHWFSFYSPYLDKRFRRSFSIRSHIGSPFRKVELYCTVLYCVDTPQPSITHHKHHHPMQTSYLSSVQSGRLQRLRRRSLYTGKLETDLNGDGVLSKARCLVVLHGTSTRYYLGAAMSRAKDHASNAQSDHLVLQ